jgi:hypothetical protein
MLFVDDPAVAGIVERRSRWKIGCLRESLSLGPSTLGGYANTALLDRLQLRFFLLFEPDASGRRAGSFGRDSLVDLEAAKKRLHERCLGLSIIKNGCILYESAQRGIKGFLDAVKTEGTELEGASVADRVVGEAVSLLCVYARVRAVYAVTLSKRGRAVLQRCSVYHEWNDLIENVLTVDRAELCPFERLVAGVSDPQVAYDRLKIACDHSKR